MITLPTQLANFMKGKDLAGLKPFALLYRNKWDSVNNKFALEDTPIDISALIAKPNTLSMTLDVNEVAQYNANNVTLTLEDTKNYFVEGTPNSYFPEGYQVYGSKVVLYYGLNTPINPYPTQVGYTVVGSPTIVDSVVSDFTLQDRIITSQNAPTDDITKYSFNIKFKIGTIGTPQSVFTYTSSNKEGVTISNTGVLRWQIGRKRGTTTDAVINSPVSISQGDEILAEGFYKGNNTFAFRVSKDGGQTWKERTVTVNPSNLTPVRTNLPFYIGTWSDNASYGYPFKGSIDLKETYIKVNGEYWFNGAHFFWKNNSTPLFTGVIKELPAHKPDKYQVDLKLVSPLEMLKDIEAKDFSDKVTGEVLTLDHTGDNNEEFYLTAQKGVGGITALYANGVKLYEGVDYEVSDLNKLNYNAVIEVKNSTVFGQEFTVDYYYWKRGLAIEEIVAGLAGLGGYTGATEDIQPVAWNTDVRSPSTASPLLAALGYYGNPAPDYKFNWRPTYGGSWAKTNQGNCTNILPQNFDYNFEISLINETSGSTVTSGSTIISLGDEYNSNTVNDGSRNIGVAGVKNGISVRIGNVKSFAASTKTIYVHQIVNGTATLLNSYSEAHASTTNPSGPITISRRGNTVTVYRAGTQMATCTITGSMDYHFQGSYRNGSSNNIKDFHAYNQNWNFYDTNLVPRGANLATPCIVTDTLDMTAGGTSWGAVQAELGQDAIYFLNAYFSTDAGATWSGAYSYNIDVNMSRPERYLYYVLGVPDNQAGFDIKDPSTYFYASTLVLNIVNLSGSTVLEALQDLALISGYEFGVDRQGVFFFRPRISSTTPVYELDHSELVKVDSVKKNLSDFFTKLTLTFAQVPLEFYANTGVRPTPIDKYGVINKEIDKPDIVNYDNPELAQAIGPQLLDVYSALPNVIQATGKLNLALELGDIVILHRNYNLIADPEGTEFEKYINQQTYYRACKITGLNYNFSKKQITYTLRDVSNSNNMPPIYAYGFPYDLPIQLGKLKTE